MRTYRVHFIRHGLTKGNLEGRYIGSTDLPLCQQGVEQLEDLIALKEYPFVDKVYTSPLVRCRQTADILFPDRAVEVVDNLREYDFGEFENRTVEELEKDPRFRQWAAASMQASAPGGESGMDLLKRSVQAMAYIFGQMMENNIYSAAVVTHGGLIMTLLANMGLPQREMIYWNAQPGCGYTALLTAQMWMRDQKFEVYGTIPVGGDNYDVDFSYGMPQEEQ